MFDNGKTEEFLLFVCNFKTTREESVTLGAGAKIRYLCTLVSGEVLRTFDVFSADVEGDTPVTLEAIILGLGTYFFLLMRCQSKSARCAAELGIRAV